MDRERRQLDAMTEMQQAQAAFEAAKAKAHNAEAEAQKARAFADALVDPDIEAIAAELAGAEAHNEAAREVEAQHEAHARTVAAQAETALSVKAARESVAAIAARLDEIKAERTALLAEVTFPVPGMTIDEDRVMLAGVPLKQASQAEELQACLAVAAARSPRLRTILVREGAVADIDTQRAIAKWAVENNYQVIFERPSGETAAGIVIEDGRVVKDLRK